MKKTYRLVTLSSILALGLSSITVPITHADPVDVQTNNMNASLFSGDGTTVDEVTLLTGDHVGLDANGEVAAITPAPRPNGSLPRFSVSTSGEHVFVVPSDVQTLVPDQLDRALFDVTALSSYGFTDSIPVIVTQSEDTALPDAAQDITQMGIDVQDSLDTLSTQIGVADVTAEDAPAKTWDLLDELATPPSSDSDPASSDTKVWLDQPIQIDPIDDQPVPQPAGDEPPWMSLIGRDQAHDDGYTGEGVTIGVIDSGIDSNHPDLVGQIIAEQDFSQSGSTYDGLGHGTFVASEIAGTGAASNGLYAGVAPGAKLINARVLDSGGNGSNSTILSGLEWTAQQGADIINMSLGLQKAYDDGSSFIDRFVDQIAQEYGCLIVVAAGNDGGGQRVSAPATSDEVIAVGATRSDGTFTSFTSYGPRRGDGAIKPEILAPGAGAVITDDQGNPVRETGIMGAQSGTDGYSESAGTSMAAPLVAGAAALVKQSDPTLDRQQIRAALMGTARPLQLTVFQQGAGLLDIPSAISHTLTTAPTQLNLGIVPAPYSSNETATLTYVNDGDEPLDLDLTGVLAYTAMIGSPVDIPDDSILPDSSSTAMDWAAMADETQDAITFSAESLTVPAGGTASVDVSVDPSAFEAGYVGGYIIATSPDGTVMQTPIGWANQSPTVNLTVALTGVPMKLTYLLNLDSGEQSYLFPFADNTASAQVLAGTYVVLAYSLVDDPDYGQTITYVPSEPFYVDADTTIPLDGSAAQPLNFDYDRTAFNESAVTLRLSDESGKSRWTYVDPTSLDEDLYGLRMAVASVPSTQEWQWSMIVRAYPEDPTTRASVECGQELPMSSYFLDWGEHAYTITDDASSISNPALLIHADPFMDPQTGEFYDDAIAMKWDQQARDGGYSAIVVDSKTPIYLEGAENVANFYYGFSSTIPVLMVPPYVSARIIAAGGHFSVLKRQQQFKFALMPIFDLSQDGPYEIVGNDDTTASVRVEHRATGLGAFTDHWDTGELGFYPDQTSPGAYTFYAQPGLEWTLTPISTPTLVNFPDFLDAAVTRYDPMTMVFSADDDVTYAFGSQIATHGYRAGQGVSRQGDMLVFDNLSLVDGRGLFFTPSSTFGSSTLTLTDLDTSQVLVDNQSGDGFSVVAGSGPASYSLDVTTTMPADMWSFSNRISSTWTWQSQDKESGFEPLPQIWYEPLGLDAYNAGSEDQPIILHVSNMDPSVPTGEVTLASSVDGGLTWESVPLAPMMQTPTGSVGNLYGEDAYGGTIHASNGDMVWLRTSVIDAESNLTQTVENAYPVTDSSRDFPTQNWSCGGGGDITPPDAPRVYRANASVVSGLAGFAEPGSTVTVTFPDGTTGTAVAGDDGSYSVWTPAGMASGQISVTATDAAGNVSDATTVYLDTDRPDPPRIDRADTVEISGGVGAVEAFAWVVIFYPELPDGGEAMTQASENGSYSFSSNPGLLSEWVVVRVYDDAGNLSDPSKAQIVQASSVKVSLRSAQLNPGDSQTVTGSNFRPLERVTVSLCSPASCTTVKTVYASLTGRVSTSFTVPKTATADTYRVTLTGATSGSGSATFEVVTPPPTPQCWFDYLFSAWLKLLGF